MAVYSTSTFSRRTSCQAAVYFSCPSLSYYGGGPPLSLLAPGCNHTGYHHPYPQSLLHYTQDPQFNPYQQQILSSTYPGSSPLKPNYYTSVATAAAAANTTGYNLAYYDGTTKY